jgi:L-asparaginase
VTPSGTTGVRLVLGALMAVALVWPLDARAQPRVRVIATGGTIANHTAGRLSGPALVESVPSISAVARVEAETFSNVSSIELTLADWVRLSKRVNDILAASDVAGVVVTSGSDTLEELAWWLDLTVGGDRVVVVTGAMRRPSDADADGPRNLADAVRVAVDPGARRHGTLVVVAGEVFRARDAVKESVTALHAFGSTSQGPIGRVNGARVTVTKPPQSPSRPPVFDIATSTQLPRVDVLLTYQQAPGDLVDAATRAGARGLIIAAAGAGAVTLAQADSLDAARRAGIPVVVASRVPHGGLTTADVPRGTIPAGTLSPVKARILLMLALARGDDLAEVAQVFRRY